MESYKVSPPACRKPSPVESWKRIAGNLFLLTAGNIIYAAGINSMIIPQHFLSGGVMGVALVAHYLIPAINAGYAYFLLNIPLFLLGWFSVSRRFILYSAYGTVALSVITAFGRFGTITIINPILAAILGGIVCGVGCGIILRSQGSAGGLDIVAVYINKKFGLRIGDTTTFVSAMVLGAGAVFLNFEAALYSLIFRLDERKGARCCADRVQPEKIRLHHIGLPPGDSIPYTFRTAPGRHIPRGQWRLFGAGKKGHFQHNHPVRTL